MEKIRVLFGADEGQLWRLVGLTEAIETAGYEVCKTSNADMVIAAMVNEDVDIAIVRGIMDVGSLSKDETLGGMIAGYVAVQKAREEGAAVPAIFLQEGKASPPKVENTEILPADPPSPNSILDLIQRMLAKERQVSLEKAFEEFRDGPQPRHVRELIRSLPEEEQLAAAIFVAQWYKELAKVLETASILFDTH